MNGAPIPVNGEMDRALALGMSAPEPARTPLYIGPVSATARKRIYRVEEAIPDRPTSSLAMLGARVAAVRSAALERDERALRGELLELADEARKLAGQAVVLPSEFADRQRIAIERDATGRGAG